MPPAAMPDPTDDDRDDAAAGDDAELTAYLDGELPESEARKIEAMLARDPDARRRVDDLKKSYDLLDFLPKREPSADFATRTVTKLLPALSDADRTQLASPSGTVPAAGRVGGSTLVLEPIERPRPWRQALLWLIVLACGAGGAYAAHAFAAPYLNERDKDRGDLASDYRLLVHLPWYLGIDDLDFLRRLDEPDLFAPDAPVSAEQNGVPTLEPNAATDRHIELFQSYPSARRAQLRKLDQDLHELPIVEQDRLRRVLEDYALWLDRLNEVDRHEVLSQANGAIRLEAVRQLRQRHWREELPEPVRRKIAGAANIAERLEYVRQFKQNQQERRDEWTLARRQWDTLHGPNRKEPWPFSDPSVAKALDDYIRTVFKVDFEIKLDPKTDLPSGSRLSKAEFVELRESKRSAAVEGKWFLYGLGIYRLAEKHPSLPEPGQRPAFVNATMLPSEYRNADKYKAFVRLLDTRTLQRGKWPEFALEFADSPRRLSLLAPPSAFFGPCKPGEFTDEVNRFLSADLLPKLNAAEKDGLAKLEGRWPEYPRQLIALSKKPSVDLAVPGVTLPGKPSLWKLYYDFVAPAAGREPAK